MNTFFTSLLILICFLNRAEGQNFASDTTTISIYIKKIKEFEKINQFDSLTLYTHKTQTLLEKNELWSRYLDISNHLARLNIERKKFAEALTILQKNRVISEKYLSKKELQFSNTIYFWGFWHFNQDKMDSAIYYYEKALALRKENLGENHPAVASTYDNLGVAYSYISKYDISLNYFQKSLTIRQKILKPNNLLLANSYNNTGNLLTRFGNFELAAEYLQKCLTIRISNLGENHSLIARVCGNLGILYEELADFYVAKEYYEKALRITRNLKDSLNLSAILLNTAVNAKKLNQYSLALKYLDEALIIHQRNRKKADENLGDIFNNYGSVHNYLLNPQKALFYFQKADKIYQEVLGEHHQSRVLALSNQGSAYFGINKFDSALVFHKKALQLSSEINSYPSTGKSRIYENIGETYLQTKDYENALFYFQKALITNSKKFQSEDITINPLVNDYIAGINQFNILRKKHKALINSSLVSRFELAIVTNQINDKLLKNLINTRLKEIDRINLQEMSNVFFEESIETCYQTYNQLPSKDTTRHLAFYFSERKKANILFNAIQEARAKSFAGIPDSLVEHERDLKVDMAYYEKSLAENADSSKQTYLREKLFAANRQYEALVARLEKEFPKYYQLKYQTEVITVPQIQAKIAPQTALIEYAIGGKNLFIFYVDKKRFEWRAVPIDTSFQTQIKEYQKHLRKDRQTEIIKLGFRLYQKLIAPVKDLLVAKSHLYIIPDGILSIIPFETLLTQPISPAWTDWTKFPFLIRQYEISYYPSATLAFDKIIKPSQSDVYEWAGFAPIFAEGQKGGEILSSNRAALPERKFSHLKHTEREVKETLQLFQNRGTESKAYLQQAASEENFKKEVGRYQYVHLATHSKGNEDNMQLAFIAFSQPDSALYQQSLRSDTAQMEDGILYAGEIYNLQLSTDLLVLSSCETGVGRLAKGEGILSILRAFTYAGARQIAYSFWSLNDSPTADLMIEFYTQILQKKRSVRSALHHAKLNLLRNSATASPRNWGGVVLMGE